MFLRILPIKSPNCWSAPPVTDCANALQSGFIRITARIYAAFYKTMSTYRMPSDVRDLVNAIPSVPHLEAILVMYRNPAKAWQADTLAKHLYISLKQAKDMLCELSEAGICAPDMDVPGSYFYYPKSNELADLILRLADYYRRNIIEISNIIHANAQKSQSQKSGRLGARLAKPRKKQE